MAAGRDEHFAAARALMVMIDEMIDGAILVDKDARIVWSNDKHVWFDDKRKALLGIRSLTEVVGQPVERVIPHSQMRDVVETGRSFPLDIMRYGEHTLLVSRLPLRDEQGEIIGALAFALKNSLTYLRPIAERFNKLQSRLARMEQELAASRAPKYSVENLVGFSPAMLQVKRLVRKAGQINSAVLVLGETGTGKELVAQAIHAASDRVDRPFVGINVAAIPENLLEAEFFGVAPGAYTGAGRQPRPGKFQLAHGGTLFLDEIGDMPLPLQAKLLRVLQEREFEAVGSNKVVRVDLRVIAATSRDLDALVRERQFRADLYYRLNVVPITLPPLRDRTEDIGSIADRILDELAFTTAAPSRELTAGAIAVLEDYDWPGNVRELRNVLERVSAMTDDAALTAEHIRAALPRAAVRSGSGDRPAEGGDRPLSDVLKDTERAAIVGALSRTGGVKAKAAKLLGISRASLYERMQALGIKEDAQGAV